jgi:hypothetical protein
MTNPVIYAAAYMLLTAQPPAHVDVVRPVAQPHAIQQLDCRPPNHLTVRWVGGHRHRHHHHDARGHHPR